MKSAGSNIIIRFKSKGLATASRRITSNSARRAMIRIGYTVVAEGGWIIKKFGSGRVERIKPIAKSKVKPVLD